MKANENVRVVNHDQTATVLEVAGVASSEITDHVAGRTVIATDGVFSDDGANLTALGGGGGGSVSDSRVKVSQTFTSGSSAFTGSAVAEVSVGSDITFQFDSGWGAYVMKINTAGLYVSEVSLVTLGAWPDPAVHVQTTGTECFTAAGDDTEAGSYSQPGSRFVSAVFRASATDIIVQDCALNGVDVSHSLKILHRVIRIA